MEYLLISLIAAVSGSALTILWWQRQLYLTLPKAPREGFTRLGAIRRLLGEQQQQIDALQQHIHEYQNVLTQVPVGYLVVDEDNHLIFWNHAACDLLHCTRAQANQRPLLEVVRSWELDDLIRTTRSLGTPQVRDWSLRTGQLTYPLRTTGIPLKTGAVGLFLEDQSAQVNQASQRDRWTTDVAHELKTPLTSIRLVLEMLVDKVEPRHSRWLERLLKEVMRLAQLVEDLLCVEQVDTQQGALLKVQSLDLTALLQDCWQGITPLADPKAMRLDYQGPESLLLEADPGQLYRAFLNLFDNAVKFATQPGTLTVIVRPYTGYVHIDLIDQGVGFLEQDLERVFERFYRADPARSRLTGGTGLGLALVREIIQAHQGRIEAANHPQGGAWLKIDLPLRQVLPKDAKDLVSSPGH